MFNEKLTSRPPTETELNAGLWRIGVTDKELTRIYNDANGLNPKHHNPITTERIFTAMRGAMAAEREQPGFTPEMVESIYAAWHGAGVDIAGADWRRFAGMLPMRSNE
jgi:hypothetical protein